MSARPSEPLAILSGDPQHVVVDAERCARTARTCVVTSGGNGTSSSSSSSITCTIRCRNSRLRASHRLGELVRPERGQLGDVDREPGHRLDGGVDDGALDLGDPVGTGRGGGEGPGHQLDLVDGSGGTRLTVLASGRGTGIGHLRCRSREHGPPCLVTIG